EGTELVEVRFPIMDCAIEYRPEQRIGAHARIERVHERMDQGLADPHRGAGRIRMDLSTHDQGSFKMYCRYILLNRPGPRNSLVDLDDCDRTKRSLTSIGRALHRWVRLGTRSKPSERMPQSCRPSRSRKQSHNTAVRPICSR